MTVVATTYEDRMALIKKIAERRKRMTKVRKQSANVIKAVQPKKKEIETPKQKPTLKVGDRVRLEDGRAVGSIDKIEKNKVIVNYGTFTTTVKKDYIEKL